MLNLIYGTPEDQIRYAGEPGWIAHDIIALPSHVLMEDYMTDEEKAEFDFEIENCPHTLVTHYGKEKIICTTCLRIWPRPDDFVADC